VAVVAEVAKELVSPSWSRPLLLRPHPTLRLRLCLASVPERLRVFQRTSSEEEGPRKTTLVIEQPANLPCGEVLSVITSRFNYSSYDLTKYEQTRLACDSPKTAYSCC
jgi:hypothetical protein